MSNKNANESAYGFVDNRSNSYEDNEVHYGLTKREYFAGVALQGLMAVPEKGNFESTEAGIKRMVELSIIASDELLKQLNQ